MTTTATKTRYEVRRGQPYHDGTPHPLWFIWDTGWNEITRSRNNGRTLSYKTEKAAIDACKRLNRYRR